MTPDEYLILRAPTKISRDGLGTTLFQSRDGRLRSRANCYSVERLRWEAQGNGNINWDDRFEMFVDFLENHLQCEPRFSPQVRASIASDLERLRNFVPVRELVDETDAGKLPYVDDDLYDRLASHVVRFCRLNPRQIPHRHNPEQYR